jgi:hypothetical protein
LQLYRAPIDGGAPVRLTILRGSRGDRRPVYVPDAHASIPEGPADDVTEIFRLDLATGQVTR